MYTDDWYIFDNKRAGYNPEVFRLRANTEVLKQLEQTTQLTTYQTDLN